MSVRRTEIDLSAHATLSTVEPGEPASIATHLSACCRPSDPRLLRGAPIAAAMRAEAKERVAAFARRYGYAPALAAVLFGGDGRGDEATAVYFGADPPEQRGGRSPGEARPPAGSDVERAPPAAPSRI